MGYLFSFGYCYYTHKDGGSITHCLICLVSELRKATHSDTMDEGLTISMRGKVIKISK